MHSGDQYNDYIGAEEYKVAIDTMPCGVIFIDRSFKILTANKSAKTIFKSIVEGKAICDTDLPHAVLLAINNSASSKRRIEMDVRLNEIQSMHYSTIIDPIYLNNTAIIVSIKDSTCIKQIDRMIVDFITNMAHEVRTPLTAITCAASIISDQGSGNDLVQEFASVIKESTKRMTDILEELMFIISIETNNNYEAMVEVRVTSILDSVIKDVQIKSGENFDQIVKSYDISPNDHITVCYKELYHALFHVIKNALIYSKDFKTLNIKVFYASKAECKVNDIVHILIKDSGIGMSDYTIERIKEALYRGDESRGANNPGNGLGLYIAQKVISKYGGSIAFESAPDVGTTVILTLPVKHQVEEA